MLAQIVEAADHTSGFSRVLPGHLPAVHRLLRVGLPSARLAVVSRKSVLFVRENVVLWLRAVLLANTDLARQLVVRSREGFDFGRYLTVSVGLFYAFVIGNTLMLFVSLIQSWFGYVYRVALFALENYRKHILLPVLTRLTHNQPKAADPNTNPGLSAAPHKIPPRFISALYVRTLNNVYPSHSAETPAYIWWDAFARQLLLKRYGLAEDQLPAASFRPLQEVLTVPSAEEFRGSVLVNASHATGWAAIVASRLAPILWNRWYATFAFFLIGFGLVHDFYVAKRLYDPNIGDLLRLQSVLREFPKIQPDGTKHQVQDDLHDGENRA